MAKKKKFVPKPKGWIRITSWKEIPYGKFLIKIKRTKGVIEYLESNIQPDKLPFIGDTWAVDVHRVVAYKDIGLND